MLALLELGTASVAPSQQLSGIATNEQGQRLAGAIVRLVTTSGRVIAQDRSRHDGAFVLRAEAGGYYRVELLRLGYRPTVITPVRVPASGSANLVVAADGDRVALRPMVVRGQRVCAERLESSDELLKLWSQVRASLAVASLSTADSSRRADVLVIERERRLSDQTVIREQQRRQVRVARPPFAAWPADSLELRGYVTEDASGTTYYLPDLMVLSSDEFMRSHCLRAYQGVGLSESQQWRVEFTPSHSPRAGLVDVSGDLFLTLVPFRVDSLTFRFEGLPAFIKRDYAVGSVSLAQTTDDALVISAWRLLVPRLAKATSKREDGLARTLLSAQPIEVAALVEYRGATIGVEHNGRPVFSRSPLRAGVQLLVPEQLRSLISDATASLSGTDLRAALAADGFFEFDVGVPGRFDVGIKLNLRRDGLDTLVRQGINLPHSSGVATVPVSEREILKMLCPFASIDRRHGVLVGTAIDSSGAPVNSTIRAQWVQSVHLPDGRKADRLQATLESISDSTRVDGRFVLCNVPRRSLSLRSGSSQWEGVKIIDYRESEAIRFERFTLRRVQP